jgi:hypothetical protein
MLLMIPCGKRARFRFTTAAAFMAVALASQGASKQKPDPGPQPNTRIEVEPLGFTAPNRAYFSYRYSTMTLDFIDKDRLLFTFRDNGLMRRLPGDPADDQDQTIHAIVLDIATGKPIEEARWRMHDRDRYLWPLRDGKFLVRQRNSLYLTDSRLELRPYLDFDTTLQAVVIAPDRKLMVLEVQKFVTPDAGDDSTGQKPPSLDAPASDKPPVRQKRTRIDMLHPGEHTILAESDARHPIDLPMVEDGFLGLLAGKDPNKWMIRKQGLHGDPTIIAEVRSSCTPTLMSVSKTVALSVGCPPSGGGDHVINAVSTMGGVLWQDLWKQRYIWPTFDYAEDGSRFAYSSLEVNRVIGTMDVFGGDDVIAQMVGVFDTETGKLVMAKDATPIMSAGHNYTLTSDGHRFAILREGAIEIYDLPPVTVPAPPSTTQKAKK